MEEVENPTILDQIKQLLSTQSTPSVAILWDFENINPGSGTLFVEGLMEYSQNYGRVQIAKAYANWSKKNLVTLGGDLNSKNFQLIHTPTKVKNSSDISMMTDGMDVALRYPEIQNFVILTGDADFMPFVSALRRNGKKIHIVCNIATASEYLLEQADSFVDFKDLIPGGDEKEYDDIHSSPRKGTKKKTTKVETKQSRDQVLERWGANLQTAVIKLTEEKKEPYLSIVKVKLGMLYPDFNETKLGFKRWINFVDYYVSKDVVTLEPGTGGGKLNVEGNRILTDTSYVQKIMKKIKELSGPKNQYVDFSYAGSELRKLGIIPKNLGYSQFKQLFQDLERQGLVKIKVRGLNHSIKPV